MPVPVHVYVHVCVAMSDTEVAVKDVAQEQAEDESNHEEEVH